MILLCGQEHVPMLIHDEICEYVLSTQSFWKTFRFWKKNGFEHNCGVHYFNRAPGTNRAEPHIMDSYFQSKKATSD